MSELANWLNELPAVSDVRDIEVTIQGKQYEGVSYRDSNFNDTVCLYLLGALPVCYRRSSRAAFLIDGEDWYIACYMQQDNIEERYREYHRFGKHFMLCRWQVPDGSVIDKYEARPYHRVPITVREKIPA